MKEIKPKVRTEMRSTYPEYFDKWQGIEISAQHKLFDLGDGSVVMKVNEDPVIQSHDEGKTWELYSGIANLAPGTALFRRKNHWVMIAGGTKLKRSFDSGRTWGQVEKIPTADDIHFQGLGHPNVFSMIETRRSGNIVIVADNFLGQEGPDGQLISSVISRDFGMTWEVSRLFGPASPLPPGPEGFGEPAVVEMRSSWLWMVMRSPYGELWQCISRDGGLTWNIPTPTGLASPIANCYAKRIPRSGATVLCWNLTKPGTATDFRSRHSLYHPRENLVFAVSHDNCRSWTCPTVVEKLGGQYPTIHFTDKSMMIMYQQTPDKVSKDFQWGNLNLMLVVYDLKEVESLPTWTAETIQPYIDEGLVAHWLALACAHPQKETIS